MLYELRTYTAAPGKLAHLHERFRTVTLGLFARHGLRVVGFWTPVEAVGSDDQLVYLLAFSDRDALESSWNAFRADPAWINAKAESERDGPLTARVESLLLAPTDYAPAL